MGSTAGVTEWRVKPLTSKASWEGPRPTLEGKAKSSVNTKSPKGLSGESSLSVLEGGAELKSSGEILLAVDPSAEGHSA